MARTTPPPTMHDLYEDLRALNLKAGRAGSDYAIAQLLGVARGQVSKWLSGQVIPSELHCMTIARELDLPLEYVLAIRAYTVADNSQNAEFKKATANTLKTVAERFCAVFIGFFCTLEILQTTLQIGF